MPPQPRSKKAAPKKAVPAKKRAPAKKAAAPAKKAPAATRRAVRFQIDPDRLHGIGDHFGDLLTPATPPAFGSLTTAAGSTPSQAFRLLRPLDLVALDVLGYDLDLVRDGNTPVLKPTSDDARLEVRFAFQHVSESAEPEQQVPPPPQTPPIEALTANGSRLVYAVDAAEQIEYSTAGILAAMSRLPLVVVPLASPRPLPPGFGRTRLGPVDLVAELPGRLRLLRSAAGLVLAPPVTRAGRPEPRPRGGRVALDRVLTSAAALRAARDALVHEAPLDVTGERRARGGLGDLLPVKPVLPRPVRQRPRAPGADETAIEAPHRLLISPSARGGFAHATSPVAAPTDPDRVELWHSRLGVRETDEEGVTTVDERANPQRVVRAVWTRDLDQPAPPVVPFIASLTRENREALVRQSADPQIAIPRPVDADRLYLSSLGAWLDLHGDWDTTPYDQLGLDSVLAWDHEAPMGRDQYVRVVEPYYFFFVGIETNLVTLTERKIKDSANPQARLYQKKFFATSRPTRTFNDRRMPFRQITLRPSVTPGLDFSTPPPFPPTVAGGVNGRGDDLFWPMVGGARFVFVLDCLDWDGRRKILPTPLLAVAAKLGNLSEKVEIVNAWKNDPQSPIAAAGQSIALAGSTRPGQTAMETITLRFTGTPGDRGSRTATPRLADADVVIPAMRHLSPGAKAVTVSYAQPYLDHGFEGPNAETQVFLKLPTPGQIVFDQGTQNSGGFVRPDLPVRGLSRTLGAVGRDVDDLVAAPPGQRFDPNAFLGGVLAELPKLFGLFKLTDILGVVGLEGAPEFITEQLDQVAALLSDLEALRAAVDEGVARTAEQAANAATSALRAQAAAARARLDTVAATLGASVDDLVAAVEALMALDTDSDVAAVTAAVTAPLQALRALVDEVVAVVREVPMPPQVKSQLDRLGGALQPALAAGQVLETITAVASFVNGFDPTGMSVRARYEWRPPMVNLPPGPADKALFFVRPDGFVLSVEARASGSDGVGVDALAELKDFGLNLFPGSPLIRIAFDRLAFRATSSRKPEVDVVFRGLEFVGVLGFIETLKELIPFDGFSDPPYVDVSTEGVKAGFDLALPNVAVGVFSLENISLGADVRVPFLGDAVTVGFYFCTRERPFRLTVMMVGGGGFVGIRLSPKGLVLLEMALEAGASLSINLGIASGSVSIMVGVYLRLEGEKGQLTGYFRIRGEVDVLGLISASITLELSLTYQFDTGKMVGRATLTIEVEIFFFSFSVSCSVERQLAGSNGDPTFAEILGVTPVGDSPAWSEYCAAFAGV